MMVKKSRCMTVHQVKVRIKLAPAITLQHQPGFALDLQGTDTFTTGMEDLRIAVSADQMEIKMEVVSG